MDKKIFKISFDPKKIKIKLPKPERGKKFGLSQNRNRDWKIMLLVTLVVVLVISGLSYNLFVRVNSGTFFRGLELNNIEARTINRIQLRTTVNSIEEMQIKFKNSLIRNPATSDPAR